MDFPIKNGDFPYSYVSLPEMYPLIDHGDWELPELAMEVLFAGKTRKNHRTIAGRWFIAMLPTGNPGFWIVLRQAI